jgi:TRAP transporter TAXI family solute receptor
VSKAWRWIVLIVAVAVTSALGVAAWMHLSKPTILKVAVGPAGFADAELMAAVSRTLNATKSSVRVAVESVPGPNEALKMLIEGQAHLAVVRGDGPSSEQIRSVAILHTDLVVIVAPEKAKIDDFGDLKGKTVGLIGPPGANDALLATLRKHYQVTGSSKALPSFPAAVVDAIRERSVDALLFIVPTMRGSKVGETWLAVRNGSRRKLAFVPIEDAAALAAAAPAYEAGEIVTGQFGGSPMLPEESVTTLQVGTYLVAARDIPNDVITHLTSALFEERQKVSADAPIASLIKAASTEKDAIIPVHPGAKVYYDGEETTLMERYGDWLFYGPMLLGALGSALVGLRRFLEPDTVGPPLLPRFDAVLSAIKDAKDLSDLEAVRADLDAAVQGLAAKCLQGASQEERAAVTAMALSYVGQLLVERRRTLLSVPEKGGSEAIRAAAE